MSDLAAIHPTPTETGETFGRVAGIAAEHGLDVEYAGDYRVCLCPDGQHDDRESAGEYRSKEAAVSKYHAVAGPKHIVRRQRMTLTALQEVTPW